MNRPRLASLATLLLAASILAGEPSAIEDSNFVPESGWNRSDAVFQYTTFYLASAAAHEVTQEWAARTAKHQLSYTVPFYSEKGTGLGDVTVNYRYQLVGAGESRVGIAPRVSLVLPTRSAKFGEPSRGIQLNVPVSAMLTDRIVSHTNVGGSWYHDRDQREINVSQAVELKVSEKLCVKVDAAYTHGVDGSELVVVRPGVQFSIAAPGGLELCPGIAFPRGGGSEGVLLFVSLARPLRNGP